MSTKHKLFNIEEMQKIEFASFVIDLFEKYEHLYFINFNIYKSNIVKEGKFKEEDYFVRVLPTMKYENSYYQWFDGGATVYEDESKMLIKENFITKFFNYLNPINFYLQSKKIKLLTKILKKKF